MNKSLVDRLPPFQLFTSRLPGIGTWIKKKHNHLYLTCSLFCSSSQSRSIEIIDTQETSTLPPPIDQSIEGVLNSKEPYPPIVMSHRETMSPEMDAHLFEQLVNTFGEMLSNNLMIHGDHSTERQLSSSIATDKKPTEMNPTVSDACRSSPCTEKLVREHETCDPSTHVVSSPNIEIHSSATKRIPKSVSPSPVHRLRNRIINKPKTH